MPFEPDLAGADPGAARAEVLGERGATVLALTPGTVGWAGVEGALAGYKWFDRNGLRPLFPFGYGLSYTAFDFTGLTAGAS